ncbi:uncharacterized protein K452DRAFT_325665 [Aplosporella prunicola CBS 121167]|uniref:RING-type domain-containing protein n=1 Tax=Aplosporella prunicola CBS 121167 TaxID=1176127 RepID=A0A6A6BHX8_9PEZI|nr:uncharacterized protein K452DRAFT_325665 [Aplosporella prunicola CBS 121167]KAF2143730.1 hypothetical protein K452DRAFT_325665 [Aplosporella prunicola CBS 121167]
MDIIRKIGNVGGVFTYVISRWALATFTVAILLNRTQFYASSRIPLDFHWHVRAAIYFIPILFLLYQTRYLLQAIRCQTSPAWSEMRYDDAKQPLAVDMAGEGGVLHKMASNLLYWEDDVASCAAVNMANPEQDFLSLSGSLSRLWPLFLTLCGSQFVETMACALQGRAPMPETGMTIFEHSLAFSEAEAMIMRPFDNGGSTAVVTRHDGSTMKLNRGLLLQILNVPPEVLVMAVISALSHLSSNVLAIAGLRTRFRLANTGVWGIAYMGVFIWTFLRITGAVEGPANDIGILRIPTVCIVGFIPHILIILGLCACATIYGIALVVTAFSLPPSDDQPLTLRQKFRAAYENLQANVHFSGSTPISVSWRDDFYTALLKIGFTVLTAASEAVFLNEGTRVRVSDMTWLEEKRINEIAERRGLVQRTIDSIPVELREDFVAEGVMSKDVLDDGTSARSGYARERKTRGQKSVPEARAAARDNGVGLLQRRGRWVMTVEFTKGLLQLAAAMNARFMISLLNRLGVTRRPQWLARLAGMGQEAGLKGDRSAASEPASRSRQRDFWILKPDGSLSLPPNDQVDVEVETKKRLEYNNQKYFKEELTEENLNSNLYSWWKSGGWWGELDSSGDYQPSQDADDDATSVISVSTNATTDDESWSDVSHDDNDDGRRTPTQEDPFPQQRSTPPSDAAIDPAHLARLLDPQSDEDKADAQLLATHLRSPGILTRSQYRKAMERDRARILTSSRGRLFNNRSGSGGAQHGAAPMTPEEEERALERFILERRHASATGASTANNGGNGDTWDSGAAGMGAGGPQCVVCQASPRTVLVWPCGCLSLCDDCRVGLATRNFDKCVCCRADVAAYSRLYVP